MRKSQENNSCFYPIVLLIVINPINKIKLKIGGQENEMGKDSFVCIDCCSCVAFD